MTKLKIELDLEMVFRKIKSCIPESSLPVPLHAPHFAGKEWDYVKECLDTGWVSSVGTYVDRFENDLVQFTGIKKAVAVVNGTAALHAALKISGIAPNDEVLIPTLTFVATANAVSYLGAIPHLIDSEQKTLGVDPEKLDQYLETIAQIKNGQLVNRKTGNPIKALIGVHIFGHPFRADLIQTLCKKYNLIFIEDAAESLGSYYQGKHTGSWGDLTILSFNGNKIITTGGGGAILTNNEKLAQKLKHITTTARIPHGYFFAHDEIGFNYRLPNINAALGCAQLEQIPLFLKNKRELAGRYQKAFEGLSGIHFFTEPKESQSNYWLNALLLDADQASMRNPLLEITNQNGMSTRPCWTLMHRLPMYSECPRMDLSTAEDIETRLINIPSGVLL
ncbi:MAG: LegC family aminotransferase [Candidatus Omnitrophica bacterium]|nr:LegC family aminotransferase [Candidatus Omnitrophota bacterium]